MEDTTRDRRAAAEQARAAGLPSRPMLRPGVRVTRVGAELLRFGLGPDSLVLADHPDLRAMLPALESGLGRVLWSGPALPALIRLAEAGLLVSAPDFWRTLRGARHAPITEAAVSALFAGPGDGAERLRRRESCAVGLDLPPEWATILEPLLSEGGLRSVRPLEEAAVRLVGRPAQCARRALDDGMRAGQPHLLVVATEGRLAVGPFVEPGRTACLRCVDAHDADRDPTRPLAVEQYADPAWQRPLPEPLDPSLLTLALALAAHDLGRWAEGGRPRTWSAVVDVAPGLRLARTAYPRHPRCGCSWGDLVAVG